jgi:hypothetical protein
VALGKVAECRIALANGIIPLPVRVVTLLTVGIAAAQRALALTAQPLAFGAEFVKLFPDPELPHGVLGWRAETSQAP